MGISVAFFLLAGVLLVIAAGVTGLVTFVYMLFYRRRINRSLMAEDAPRAPLPAPKTVGIITLFFVIILIAAIIIPQVTPTEPDFSQCGVNAYSQAEFTEAYGSFYTEQTLTAHGDYDKSIYTDHDVTYTVYTLAGDTKAYVPYFVIYARYTGTQTFDECSIAYNFRAMDSVSTTVTDFAPFDGSDFVIIGTRPALYDCNLTLDFYQTNGEKTEIDLENSLLTSSITI
ncbi:MAG: hypothetical protein QM689_11195 [Oscillospiraceae bacterium]